MRIRSLTVMLALLAVMLTGVINHAQESGPKTLTGRLAPAKTSELKLELEGYNGELRLKTLLAPGMEVAEGDVIAEVEAPELAEQTADAEAAVTRAQLGVESMRDSISHKEKQLALQLESAQRSLARAQEALTYFQETRKAERIRDAELNMESRENSIQDQKEELAQLEKLYKGNDLAKESQDIVLNRSKRRLKQAEERYEMAKNRHQRFLNVDLVREEEDLKAALENAKLGLESVQNPNLNGLTGMRLKLEGSEQGLEAAQEHLAKLKGDAEKLTLKAPHAGVVVVGAAAGNDSISQPFKVGDKLGNGQVLASVIDTGKLEVTVDVTLEGRASYQPGTPVEVSLEDGSASAPGSVEAIGFMVDKNGNVSARISVDNSEGKLLPGASVKVALAQ